LVAAVSFTADRLKLHGHIAGEAKVAAVEISARLTDRTQREIRHYYGGISSSAVAMMRRKVRTSGARLHARIATLIMRVLP